MPLHVHDGEVPIQVHDPALGEPVRTIVRAHLTRSPLALHVASDALGDREDAGRAIASLFRQSVKYPFDGEWALAWQAAERVAAASLRFDTDDDAHAAKMAVAAAQIAKIASGNLKLKQREKKQADAPPPRELKDVQPGISSVGVVQGSKPEPKKEPTRPDLKQRKLPSGSGDTEPVANTNYTTAQLQDYGWGVLSNVLAREDGKELEDFRRRHGVGADGAFDWKEFVELKATGRSMQSSISLTPAEFTRAVEKGNDYILALVYGCEKGHQTKVKLIFDPARRASLRETEGVRLSGLPDAAGIEISLGEDENVTAAAAST